MSTTYFFLPPLRKATGGLAVLHQMATHLHDAGVDVALSPREDKYWKPEFSKTVPVTGWQHIKLKPEDIWVVPEGWISGLTPGLQSGAKCLLYVQNWAYFFSGLPEGVTWDQLPVSFAAVSDPVSWYIHEATGQSAPILRPGIDLSRFSPQPTRQTSTIRIAYMPRKNKALASQIRALLESRAKRLSTPNVEWVEIHGLSPDEVANRLRSCHIFLVTGYPEGCPLPPLEAMACGCFCVGFAGLGGFDYMRQSADHPGEAKPWFPLRETPWQGNGLWTADADVMATTLALEKAIHAAAGNTPLYTETVQAALDTARHYSIESQRRSVISLWESFA